MLGRSRISRLGLGIAARRTLGRVRALCSRLTVKEAVAVEGSRENVSVLVGSYPPS